MIQATAEPGSFRDPDSRVVVSSDSVYRLLSDQAREDWNALSRSDLFARRIADGSLVGTRELPADSVAQLRSLATSHNLLAAECAAVLEHDPVPFISYPYEWTFGMLRDAALLQLELLIDALDEELTLKDASSYNVQWRGTSPVFIDTGSFERLQPGEPWAGYRQFCSLYLYPLLLQAYCELDFQKWMRGSLEGITPTEARRILGLRNLMHRGVLTHVVLHSRFERRYETLRGAEAKRSLKEARFSPKMIAANAKGLASLIRSLRWRPDDTAWTGYRDDNTYTDQDATLKAAFVKTTAARRSWNIAWDIGCNDGAYARLLKDHARYVLAFDLDHASVDHLYEALRNAEERSILPLVIDIADPSPGLGWRGSERQTLLDRGRPDLVLCLALIHHVSIGRNVPVREFCAWLRDLDAVVVLEFPTRDDPMVQRLLSGKRCDSHPDYKPEALESALTTHFHIARKETLPSGTRVLYELTPA